MVLRLDPLRKILGDLYLNDPGQAERLVESSVFSKPYHGDFPDASGCSSANRGLQPSDRIVP